MNSFGNDRTGFYNHYEREQQKSTGQAMMNKKAYPKLKTVITRGGNAMNHPALAQQMRRKTGGARSSIVGPTIKNNSRLASYFPEITPQKGMDISDEGYVEPMMQDTS